ncbi:maleylacetoacetate isomerase-like isoform X2 [Pollicipes pollicipes]|uniref:maleylacetoacetate isomerase-like isoform X2 n=2 Tax=Pollicipes pollicipes TaxID=41117 RepID=UPI001884F4E8|nr:maleylacetoacetate isomerase-like isoform X2 [Pollicipes pollicipes]
MVMILYSYFRSSCSWRVRLVLALKDIQYEYQPVNLLSGDQLADEYGSVNPMNQVPSLEVDGKVMTQSMSIMEFLEETYPKPSLLPDDPFQRAKVREICELIGSGIQPVQNLAVLKRVAALAGDEARRRWGREAIERGFGALEPILAASAGTCCVGDTATLADCCLVPQVFNASRFQVDMSQFPTISRVHGHLETLEPFQAAHFSRQPDCPPELR